MSDKESLDLTKTQPTPGPIITQASRMAEKALECFDSEVEKENYISRGAELFQKLVRDHPGASDFQFRTDLFPYYQSGRKCAHISKDSDRIRAKDIAGILLALYRSKSGGIRDDNKNNYDRDDAELISILTRDKKINFACEGNIIVGVLQTGRIRGQAFFDQRGLALTCRILNEEVVPLEKLNFSSDTALTIRDLVQKRSGLCLITGVTGAGKSTTLASIVAFIKDHLSMHVVTIEDPVEYTFSDTKEGSDEVCDSLITQREVGLKVDSFEQGLEDALREKPNVIMVGEIRTKRTMQTAMEAVQSGHLVLSTMHTRGAAATFGRILEWYAKEDASSVLGQLSDTVLFILSQDLFPDARSEKGLVLCYEMLVNTSNEVSSAIKKFAETAGASTLDQSLSQNGGIAWDNQLQRLVESGHVTRDFAKNHFRNKAREEERSI